MSHTETRHGEVVHPVFLVYFRSMRDPAKPSAQVWYGDYDADWNEYGGFLEKTKHLRMPNGKFKVNWEHRFLGIENLMQLYPYKVDPEWLAKEIGVKSSPSTLSAEAPPEPSRS